MSTNSTDKKNNLDTFIYILIHVVEQLPLPLLSLPGNNRAKILYKQKRRDHYCACSEVKLTAKNVIYTREPVAPP